MKIMSIKNNIHLNKINKDNSISDEHRLYLKCVKAHKIKVTVSRILILIVFIGLWQIAADLKWIDPFLTSSPI